MRYVLGLVCVLALAVMGCSEGANDLCEGVVCRDTECRSGGLCDPSDGVCDFTAVPDGTACGDDAGTCQEGSCQVACSEQGIRDAIAAGGGPYTFDCADGTTMLTQATIEIDNDVILDGEGDLTVDGNAQHPVFTVLPGAVVELRRLTVTQGTLGIRNEGELTLLESTVSGNSGPALGGISNHGILALESTTVSRNVATGDEEAVDVVGGIYSSGPLTLTNSTVSGNSATGEHAVDGVFNLRDALTLTNSTVLDGIYAVGPGSVTSTATIHVGECFEEWPSDLIAWGSGGYNVGCDFDDPADLHGDARLGPLQDNGGPTETHALLPGSVAIDQIPAEDCVDADGLPLTTDQRGEPRPEPGGTDCDVGAFEVQP